MIVSHSLIFTHVCTNILTFSLSLLKKRTQIHQNKHDNIINNNKNITQGKEMNGMNGKVTEHFRTIFCVVGGKCNYKCVSSNATNEFLEF